MTSLTEYRTTIMKAAQCGIDELGFGWLSESVKALEGSDDPINALLARSAMAQRRLGVSPLASAKPLATPYANLEISYWGASEAGRIALILAVAARKDIDTNPLLSDFYRAGDESERIALTRGVILFGSGASARQIALTSGRSNSSALFSALAQRNPYPGHFYSDEEFNQMVLKSLFVGLELEPVVDLQRRANSDLSRMCEDYIEERRSAGRPVPADIWLALAPCPSSYGEELLREYSSHPDPRHRHYTKQAMEFRKDKALETG